MEIGDRGEIGVIVMLLVVMVNNNEIVHVLTQHPNMVVKIVLELLMKKGTAPWDHVPVSEWVWVRHAQGVLRHPLRQFLLLRG